MTRTFVVTLGLLFGIVPVAGAAGAENPSGRAPHVAQAQGGLLESLDRITRAYTLTRASAQMGQMDLDSAPLVVAARERADAVRRQLRRNQALVGAAALAAGLLVAQSHNEWTPDEGYIGSAGAAIGLGLVIDAAIPSRWR